MRRMRWPNSTTYLNGSVHEGHRAAIHCLDLGLHGNEPHTVQERVRVGQAQRVYT
jgi:hypothetical protein